jgi:D-serine dehydratase
MNVSLQQLKNQYPLIENLTSLEETIWFNPNRSSKETDNSTIAQEAIKDAEARLERFQSYIKKAFPETKETNGVIESPLVQIPTMKATLEKRINQQIPGELLLKCDSHLPISGSIKARGGIYEILKHAEKLATDHGMLQKNDDYSKLDNESFREFFSNYSIAVGSTGNLGLSIGIIGAKLGFNVTVHMSADAKQWKKELLRKKGVTVIEYESDYSKAVEKGRALAEKDPNCHFVDDENSTDLFLGYATAASRLKTQLQELEVTIDEAHPLFVYLPCGVGGGPGGVAYGLHQIFGNAVHCFFAEPTHSPAMLLGLMTGLHDEISVEAIGLDNKTAADGLACARPSGFVGKVIEPFLAGAYTVSDEKMYRMLTDLANTENIQLEPSALAGMIGPVKLRKEGTAFIESKELQGKMENATHLVWGTGGSMVPEKEMQTYIQKGKDIGEILI